MNKTTKKVALIVVISVLLVSYLPSLFDGQANKEVVNNDDTSKEEDKSQNEDNSDDSNDSEEDITSEDDFYEGNVEDDNKDIDNKDIDNKDIDPKEDIDLLLKPNEIGQVMVLMYHSISENESEWSRTPENFRRDLQTLYDNGYRAISLKDYVNNNIGVEAGYTPVVFTFDDGNQNNFNILKEEENLVIDPNSAIGIMEEFKKEYPDFNATATFFLNGSNPFRQSDLIEYKLNWLIENGYDIGNHTLNHNSMKGLNDSEEIQKYIGAQATFLESFTDEYIIDTYALCNGERPEKDYNQYLAKGSYENKDYNNIAILEVGWDPSVSPIDKKFNPLAIHRVRASETKVDGVGMYDWLDFFDRGTRIRYISDGNSEVVTVPVKYADRVDEEKIGDKLLYIYE